MRFWLRWIANGIAIFLGALPDGLACSTSASTSRPPGRWWWRPSSWASSTASSGRSTAPGASLSARPWSPSVTVLVNAFILQLFVWVGADVTSRGFLWVLLAAAFVTLVTGLINWQVGFGRAGSSSPDAARGPDGPRGTEGRRPAASDVPRPVRTERKRLS